MQLVKQCMHKHKKFQKKKIFQKKSILQHYDAISIFLQKVGICSLQRICTYFVFKNPWRNGLVTAITLQIQKFKIAWYPSPFTK